MDVSDYEEKGETVEPHSVSTINISAQNGSNISAPMIINSTLTGNVTFSSNYFAGPAAVGPAAEITDTSSLITEYKKFLLSEYAYITEYTSRAGEQVLLNDRYIDPLIVQKHREKKERENEMRSRGERFFSARESNQRNQSISLDKLFSPDNSSKKVTPRAVILQGDSGSGKSITAQKILLDWASGELYANLFDVVFHLRCKELSGLSGEMSFVDLLECSFTPYEIGQILKDVPQRILFIIDGFDELMLSASKKVLPPKPVIKSHPMAIVCSLLKGCMMRESFLLVTTRSNAVDKLENVLKKPQCFIEIMGFSEKGVSEYFQRFFEDEEFSRQVYEQVKIHEMLYTACFIPVICWIICTIFKRKGRDGVATSELTTTTSIFVDFVFTLLKHHSSLSQREELDLLRNLGQLAESGTSKRQVLFPRNDLQKAISDLPSIPFLCTFRQQERTYLKEMFGFMHLSFQEFFTALFYVLTDKVDAETKIKELLESASIGRYNEHLFPVIRFLFGLSNKKVSRLLKGVNPQSTSTVLRAQLEKWISKVIKKDMLYMSDFILHCLYELHDKDTLKNVMKLWERSGITIRWSLKGIDSQVVMYCLQYSARIISMEVKCNAKDLKMLHPAFCRCTALWLDFDSISDSDVILLTSALGRRKDVRYLTMENGDLSDESVQKILKTLSGQTSVGSVRLVLRSVNDANVDLTMNFLVKEMMGKRFSVCIASQAETIRTSLCSEFTMASKDDSVWFTVGHSDRHQAEISEKHGLSYYQGFSKISFALCPFSAIPMTEFLKASHNLRCFSELKSMEFGVNVDALLSFLSGVPGLSELDLRTEFLTDIWTSRILCFLQVNPKISHIKFHVSNLMISVDERICSTFSVFRKPFEPYKMHESESKNPSLTLTMDRWALDMAYGSSREATHSYCLEKSALVKLALSFPPLEGSSVMWEVLFKRLYQLIQLTEQCPELDERTDSLLQFLHSVPGLKEVKVWLNSLIESWAAGLFTLFLSSSSLLHMQLNTSMSLVGDVESLGVMREDGVILSVGCNHLNYIDEFCDIDLVNLFKPSEHRVLPCVTITVTDDSENANADWRRFFQAYNQLKDSTECSSEYDESVRDLVSVLHSVSGLKKLDLIVRFMTVDGASRVLDLSQRNASLTGLYFLAVERPETSKADFQKDYGNEFSRTSESEEDSDSDRSDDFCCQSARKMWSDSDEDSDSDQLDDVECILCSALSMWRTESGQCSVILKSNVSSPGSQSLLSRIELTLNQSPGETSSDWNSFLRAYNQCKGISSSSPASGECVDALLLSLHSLSALRKVQLTTDSLTDNWALKILSLCHTCARLNHVCLQVEYDDRSSLKVTRNIPDSFWAVDIRLARDGMMEISPSFISFTIPCSELPKLSVQELFETLDLLKGLEEGNSEHEELVGDLMSSLLSVSGLRRIGLEIGGLTENWVRRIASSAGDCPSLQEIRCDCIESGSLLLEDVVRILQGSPMNSDCRIIITRMKRSKMTDGNTSRSSSACSEKGTVSFCRDSLTKLFTVENIETEDYNDDDPDEEDFIDL